MSHASRKRRGRRARGGAGRVFVLFGIFVLVSTVLGGLTVVGVVVGIANEASLGNLKPADPGQTSVIYARDGQRLATIPSDVLRQPITQASIPDNLKQATVAVEDRRFYQHSGVDFEGIARAAVRNAQSGRTVEGGSTLTMQLVRNLYSRDNSDSYARKIQEAKLAEDLERAHPGRTGKEWILAKYLNNVPYGNASNGQEVYGVQAAARTFFDKPASSLKVHEAALIAGLPQAPTQYNPFLNPRGAKDRRDDVLRRMADQGFISAATARRAQERSLGTKRGDFYTERREGFFVDYVRRELIRKYGKDRVSKGGLKVYTTIDLKKQQAARESITSSLGAPSDPSSALVSLDPDTGDIETMASSAAYGSGAQFNLAEQGSRQPGSTYKLMVLMAALREGYDPRRTSYRSPGSITIPGAPTSPKGPGYGSFSVKNFAGESAKGGSMNLEQATLQSVNTVFIQLGIDVGMRKVTKAARDMGITSKLQSYPAESLGGLSEGVSPLEIARAYATIANGGKRVVPRAITKVEFPSGRTSRPQRIRSKRTFSKAVASEAIRILEKDIQSGTAKAADFGCPAGGKTGTTDGPSDVWLAGFTPQMATAVWVGYPGTRQDITFTSSAGGNIQGATVAAPIWKGYMAKAGRGSCEAFSGLVPFRGTVRGGQGSASSSSADDSSTGGGAGATNRPASAGTGDGGGSDEVAPSDEGRFPSELYEGEPIR